MLLLLRARVRELLLLLLLPEELLRSDERHSGIVGDGVGGRDCRIRVDVHANPGCGDSSAC